MYYLDHFIVNCVIQKNNSQNFIINMKNKLKIVHFIPYTNHNSEKKHKL